METKTTAKDVLKIAEKVGEDTPDYPSRRESDHDHLTLEDITRAFTSTTSSKSLDAITARRSSRRLSSKKSSRLHSRRGSCRGRSKTPGARSSRSRSKSPGRSPRSKSPHSHKSHKKHHHKEQSAHNLKFKDLEAAEEDKTGGDNGETKSTSFKLWVGIAFLLLLAIAGGAVFFMFSGASKCDVPITEEIMDAYNIDDADMYNPDAWINALKELPQKQYTLDLIPACRIAVSLTKKQPKDPNFEKKMSILYHILAHVYYFTYSGQGIDAKWVRRQSKYGDLLMKVFEDWSTFCPNVNNPWMYKKCILKTPKDAEFNMSDYAVQNRDAQIEEASAKLKRCTKEYNFLDQYDRSDYEW